MSANKSTAFDPNSVPKPSNYELEKPYGGTKGFMESYGLKVWELDDHEERKAILDGLREHEWQSRVEAARERHEGQLRGAGRK
ncbi:Hypothetical predicted protein [Lecanosticta acicola]|uniref:Uncharacterized protein n=1 Tax=Lecanosticta acicola TaxID=111012 RepID=A0AAI8Z5K6_9PEZI|nr:Hypothetical predicted protein [Lecanosticta acicola]